MNLIVPINNYKLVSYYQFLGIKEVYGGFIDEEIQKQAPFSKGILNGRPIEKANFKNKEEIQKTIDTCKKVGIKFHLTFNLLPYLGDDTLLKKAIKNIRDINFESIIIADVNLIPFFEDKEIVISTLSSVYNTEHIRLWNKQGNIKKIVLPRELSIREQKKIILAFPELNFEILVFNDWCYNNDGTCSSIHFEYLPDKTKYSCKRDDDFYSVGKENIEKNLKNLTTNRGDCRSCLMHHFLEFGDRMSFKVAGRSRDIDILKKDILYMQQSFKLLQKYNNYKEYNNANIKLYNMVYKKQCDYENCEMYNNYKK